jgi:formylglycine-generating enzyme required for sulfatase activity
VGWFNGINVNPNGGIATVDSPSPVGAYDMSGNVWEWCNDRYGSDYYATVEASGTDPEGPTSSLSYPDRVIRGGGWNDFYGITRSASRYGIAPHITANHGFRIAR